ncbi:MAG: hypothetical protein AAB518_04270 [Patescibacteria group bacterium]
MASLGAMLLLGSVIIEVGLIGVLLVTLLTSANVGVRLSAEALGAAYAGIQEGMLAILRDKDGPYNINPFTVGNAGATVTICQDLIGAPAPGDCPNALLAQGIYEIHALGDALTRQRWLVAVVEVNAATGLIRIQSVEEKTR